MMHEWAVRRRPEAVDNYLVNFLVKCGSANAINGCGTDLRSRDVDTRNSVATALGAIDQEEATIGSQCDTIRKFTDGTAAWMRPHCDCCESAWRHRHIRRRVHGRGCICASSERRICDEAANASPLFGATYRYHDAIHS